MATKEATVYIVDVGESMSQKRHGRDVTDLEWALEYVWDKITTTVATDRKTAHVGVIALKTDDSSNELDSEEAYQHISVLQDLKQTLMPDVRRLREQLRPSATEGGDVLSALVIAIQMITTHCKQLQYVRRIVLVTNGHGTMDVSDVESITSKIKDDKMELLILGLDFDDADYGSKEEDKDPAKATNEAILKQIADDCEGTYGTLAQAIDELSLPRIKTVRPIHSFKGYLTLGNPEEYDTAMAIDVERYPKIMVAKPPSASSFVIRSDMAPGESTQASGNLPAQEVNQDGLAAVKNARTYQVPDEFAPGGKRDVEQGELAKGYAYGSTAVYIAESDRNVTTYETKQGLDIIGFVAREKYERYLDMSRTNVIVAQRTNDKAAMALSSFIHALYELESYAVARLVAKNDKAPLVLLLAPSIEPDLECLYDIELPFAEDIRSYRFPPLDRIISVSGKTITQHRNLPSTDLQNAMSAYVDSMDLSTYATNDEGQPTEHAPIDETFSPILHRVGQVVRHRAVYPANDLPPIPEALTKYSHPPSDLADAAKPHIAAILAAADMKKVPPKARSRRAQKRSEVQKPLSGLDVGALLNEPGTREKRKRISAENAVPEFKQLLDSGGGDAVIRDAAAQMGEIVRGYIKHSFGETGYGRAIEAMRVLREEMLDLEEPAAYNEFLRALKKDILGEKLGGYREDMWWEIRRNRLGLITKKEISASEVEEDAAKEFMKPK